MDACLGGELEYNSLFPIHGQQTGATVRNTTKEKRKTPEDMNLRGGLLEFVKRSSLLFFLIKWEISINNSVRHSKPGSQNVRPKVSLSVLSLLHNFPEQKRIGKMF